MKENNTTRNAKDKAMSKTLKENGQYSVTQSSIGGENAYQVIIDHGSRSTRIEFLNNKRSAMAMFKSLVNNVAWCEG